MGMLSDLWVDLAGRSLGPLSFRLIVQPCVAVFMAIRAGARDARSDRTPYVWALWTGRAQRRALMHEGWKDVGRLFLLAMALDAVYQWLVFRWIYLLQALAVAFVLAFVPYLLLRGPVTRIMRRFVSAT